MVYMVKNLISGKIWNPDKKSGKKTGDKREKNTKKLDYNLGLRHEVKIELFIKLRLLKVDCPISKGNQEPHPKVERPDGKILKSKKFLTSIKNW